MQDKNIDKGTVAANLYHGSAGYNCAQAVLKTFQDEAGFSNELLVRADSIGGGRAPDGVCGALYATKVLVNDISMVALITEQFVARTGSHECNYIENSGKITCSQCVRLAAKLVEPHLNLITTNQGKAGYLEHISKMIPIDPRT